MHTTLDVAFEGICIFDRKLAGNGAEPDRLGWRELFVRRELSQS